MKLYQDFMRKNRNMRHNMCRRNKNLSFKYTNVDIRNLDPTNYPQTEYNSPNITDVNGTLT